MKNLLKLKHILSTYSILHIDSYDYFLRTVSSKLTNIFKNTYQAKNGIEGYNLFIKYKPDIVMIDLDIEGKSGFELIVDMKQINPKIKIIILSDKNDDFELINCLDIDLYSKIEKPFDINNLYKIFQNLKPNTNQPKTDSHIITRLKTIAKNKEELEFLNNYKGVSLKNKGKILGVKDDIFSVRVTKSLIVALEYEKYTLIKIDTMKHIYIIAKLLKYDKKNNIITLSNPQQINRQLREPKYKRMKVDSTFKTTATVKKYQISFVPLEISEQYLYAYIKVKPSTFKINDKLDLTLGFHIDGPSSFIKERKFTKVFAHSNIKRIDRYKDGVKILFQIHIAKAGQSVFYKYIQEREFAIIQEFKMKLKI